MTEEHSKPLGGADVEDASRFAEQFSPSAFPSGILHSDIELSFLRWRFYPAAMLTARLAAHPHVVSPEFLDTYNLT